MRATSPNKNFSVISIKKTSHGVSGLPAIRVRDLTKVFNLNMRYNNTLKSSISHYFQQFRNKTQNENNCFRALNNISFEVVKGEVFGVIGANGAGKSTLLKLLGNISLPSSGTIEVSGRVASILDIGTGFHAELSGRENIYLSGSMMGMSKNEIDERIENIIQFSGIKNFIDVPVKKYSSGMFIRLAFSVVAHLEADIILLDEIISVGDAEFRIKSFNKIKELARGGKTIIVVSHDLNSLLNLAQRCLQLENGSVKEIGKPSDIVINYMQETLLSIIKKKKDEDELAAAEKLNLVQKELEQLANNIREKEDLLHDQMRREEELSGKLEQTNRQHFEVVSDFSRRMSELEAQKKELEKKQQAQQRAKSELEKKVREKSNIITPVIEFKSIAEAPGNDLFRIKKVEFSVDGKIPGEKIFPSDDIRLSFEYWKLTDKPSLLTYVLKYQLSVPAFAANPFHNSCGASGSFIESKGLYEEICVIPSQLLNNGLFTIDIYFVDERCEVTLFQPDILTFKIDYDPAYLEKYSLNGKFTGPFFPLLKWEMKKSDRT